MRSKLLNADPPITYAVVLDTGDDVIGELGNLVREQEVEAASLSAQAQGSRNRPRPDRHCLIRFVGCRWARSSRGRTKESGNGEDARNRTADGVDRHRSAVRGRV